MSSPTQLSTFSSPLGRPEKSSQRILRFGPHRDYWALGVLLQKMRLLDHLVQHALKQGVENFSTSCHVPWSATSFKHWKGIIHQWSKLLRDTICMPLLEMPCHKALDDWVKLLGAILFQASLIRLATASSRGWMIRLSGISWALPTGASRR